MEHGDVIKNTLIKQELLNKLPDWCKSDLSPDNYYLVCTDDMDSFYSCTRLSTLFGLEIGGFYDFNSGLWLNEEKIEYGWKKPIFVDLSISHDQYCYDNHKTFISNPNVVNPNIIQREYHKKYNMGTIALICALYGGVDQMDDKLRTMLLTIDGGYSGYYNAGGKWRHINLYWMDMLGLTDYLLPILKKHDANYFRNFASDYHLNEKITIVNGYLKTKYNCGLPDYKFELVQPVQKVFYSKNEAIKLHNRDKERILVSAETRRDSYVLNLIV